MQVRMSLFLFKALIYVCRYVTIFSINFYSLFSNPVDTIFSQNLLLLQPLQIYLSRVIYK